MGWAAEEDPAAHQDEDAWRLDEGSASEGLQGGTAQRETGSSNGNTQASNTTRA